MVGNEASEKPKIPSACHLLKEEAFSLKKVRYSLSMKLSGHRFALALAFAGIVLAACGESGNSQSEASYEFPVAGTLGSNRYEVLLHTTPDGPRYSLMESDGNKVGILLAQEMTASEFEERFQLIHELVRGVWAGSDLPANFSKKLPVERSARLEWKPFESEASEVEIELPPLPDLRNED